MATVNTSIYENIYDRLQLSTQMRFTVDYVVKSGRDLVGVNSKDRWNVSEFEENKLDIYGVRSWLTVKRFQRESRAADDYN